jgi:AmmeMemoRadiSam system protein B
MDIRHPAVAGSFYPSDREKLSSQLNEFFSKAGQEQKCRIVVSPHAGYAYSGQGAANAIASLVPAKAFIILGPNHTGMGQEFSLMKEGVWKTPLGDTEVDSSIAKELIESGTAEPDDWAHASEHSIEVQLPFLQHRFGAGFSFVPVCIMNTGYSDDFLEKVERLGKAIAEMMRGREIGLIASSDFSHFVPAKSAKRFDMEAIDKIKSLDAKGFFRTLQKNRASVCGFGPIAAAISAAKELGVEKAELLSYTNSGDVTGDHSSVVAYAAIGFC